MMASSAGQGRPSADLVDIRDKGCYSTFLIIS